MTKSINFDTDIVKFTMGSAGVEAAIVHNLGRIPEDGIIIQQKGVAGNLFRSGTTWTKTTVYFKSGVTGAFYAVLLI